MVRLPYTVYVLVTCSNPLKIRLRRLRRLRPVAAGCGRLRAVVSGCMKKVTSTPRGGRVAAFRMGSRSLNNKG